MFVEAIERILPFLRPIHFISRLHGHRTVVPGSATLFFVNESGSAVTCRHVAKDIEAAARINTTYKQFRGKEREIRNHPDYKRLLRELQETFQIRDETILQLQSRFVNCTDSPDAPTILLHPNEHVDLAIVQFKNYTRRFYRSYATFVADSSRIRPGRSLCRIGYPFPDFTNFGYNPNLDEIEWTTARDYYVPFPIDGLVTRLLPNKGGITEIELTSPGLRGQSGGPLFDSSGLVYGMQSATDHLHLGLDVEDREVLVRNRRSRVSHYPFLNVGLCVHVDRIKEFLRDNQVKFYEA